MQGLKDKTILITGGFGFIGRHLTKYLIDLGARPVLLSRSVHESSSDVFQIDLLDGNFEKNILKGYEFDGVVHLASMGSIKRNYPNVVNDALMVANLFELFKNDLPPKFVFLGSADQYGNQSSPQTEQALPIPINTYALSKNLVDNITEYISHTTATSITTLRPFSVYGPNQPAHMFLSQLIGCCKTMQPFRMSHGNQIRDFVFVDDVCQAIACAICSDTQGIYNIGTGIGTRLWDLVELVLELTNSNIQVHRGYYTPSGDPAILIADVNEQPKSLAGDLKHH